jgi:RNA polymerase sigma-70 factor (ECF subfamily)
MASVDPEMDGLLERASKGDNAALGELFDRHRSRLRRLLQLRMDRRLQGRVDPSDVLQDAYLEMARALPAYLRDPSAPFYLWLRCITGRKLRALHRTHLATDKRAAGREVPMPGVDVPASSLSAAEALVGDSTSPSEAAARAELRLRVQQVLEEMEPLDREVLVLRHFEQLSNAETALVLGIAESAASNRFVRSLKRLRGILLDRPGILESELAVEGASDPALVIDAQEKNKRRPGDG